MKHKKFYETDEAKRTIREWNKKLKDSGFKDIESSSYVENDSIRKEEITVNHASVVYFQKCSQYLHSTAIKDPTDRFIFEQHCDGVSNREIANKMVSQGLKPIHTANVDRRLLRILNLAGIKPIKFNF